MTDAAIGQIITVAVTGAGFLWQYVRENRQRRWDLEDRRMARENTARVATDLAETVSDSNRSLHEAIADNTCKTEKAITSADAAYAEANSVNLKIEQLGIEKNAIDRAAKQR